MDQAATHYHTQAWQTLIHGKDCFSLLLQFTDEIVSLQFTGEIVSLQFTSDIVSVQFTDDIVSRNINSILI